MSDRDLAAIHAVIVATLRAHNDRTAAAQDIISLLSPLDPLEKRSLWDWLEQHDPNLKRWLAQQGQHRRAAA